MEQNAHTKLMTDLLTLVKNATNYHYHDFKNPDEIPTPKIVLMRGLYDMQHRLTKGDYDNKPDDEDKEGLRKYCEAAGFDNDTIKEVFGL